MCFFLALSEVVAKTNIWKSLWSIKNPNTLSKQINFRLELQYIAKCWNIMWKIKWRLLHCSTDKMILHTSFILTSWQCRFYNYKKASFEIEFDTISNEPYTFVWTGGYKWLPQWYQSSWISIVLKVPSQPLDNVDTILPVDRK